jgi:hypothetical protein
MSVLTSIIGFPVADFAEAIAQAYAVGGPPA